MLDSEDYNYVYTKSTLIQPSLNTYHSYRNTYDQEYPAFIVWIIIYASIYWNMEEESLYMTFLPVVILALSTYVFWEIVPEDLQWVQEVVEADKCLFWFYKMLCMLIVYVCIVFTKQTQMST